MKKNVLKNWMALGAAACVSLMTGCSSDKGMSASGSMGILGSRDLIPAPYNTPAQLRQLPIDANKQHAAQLPQEGGTIDDGAVVAFEGGDSDAPISGVRLSSITENPNAMPDEGAVQPLLPLNPEGAATDANAGDKAGETHKYVVKRGDTLSKIALAHGVRWQDIATVNHLGADGRIRVGDTIELPANAITQPDDMTAPAVSTAAATKGTGDKAATAGDGTAAAATTGTGVNAKPLPADGVYVVVSGDNLWKIARKYGVTTNNIREWNSLKSDKLTVGQKLKLKATADAGNASAAPVETKKTTAAAATTTKNTVAAVDTNAGLSEGKYIVKQGDNLWKIARKNKVTEKDIRAWNNLTSDNLRPGQVLIVRENGSAAPVAAPERKKDDVVSFSENTTRPSATNDADAAVAVQQQAKSDTTPYEVQPNDTLDSVLKRFGMSLDKFKELNPNFDEMSGLQPGQSVIVPYEE